MSAPEELYELVERFDRNREAYRSGRYNETMVRVDFIDPLLGLLGWDVHNRLGRPEAYRDVVHEDRVKVGGGTRPRTMASTPAAPGGSSWRPRSPRWTSEVA